jgi:hypothetical protein
MNLAQALKDMQDAVDALKGKDLTNPEKTKLQGILNDSNKDLIENAGVVKTAASEVKTTLEAIKALVQ